MHSTCVQEGSRVPNLQMEFNYLDSFKSYGIFSDFVVPTWSAWSPHCPCHPHVVLTLSPSSPCHAHSSQKVPMWSPWSVVSVVSTCCLRGPHVIPTSSLSSPCHLEGLYIIPNPPDTHSTHPPLPWGDRGPRISKNAIRFELIEIF